MMNRDSIPKHVADAAYEAGFKGDMRDCIAAALSALMTDAMVEVDCGYCGGTGFIRHPQDGTWSCDDCSAGLVSVRASAVLGSVLKRETER